MVTDVNEAIRKEGYRRRLSPRTIKTYQKCVEKFLRKTKKSIDKLSKKDVRIFLEDLSDRGVAGSTLNVNHMAIKFLLEEILNKKMRLNIKYSKVPRRLPTVLSKEEIKRLFEAIKNEKHRVMIQLLYSAGLRANELINLRVKDLEIDKGYGYVRNGKGGRDRIFILADRIKFGLVRLISIENLNEDSFLFKSNRKRTYHIRSLQNIIKVAAKKARIKKRVSPHTLRHSFATHLIENGYDMISAQILLGHKSPETTLIYVHSAPSKFINVESPLDKL